MRGVQSPDLKAEAIALRRQGVSLPSIHTKLNIPLSTLSGWFRNVQLTNEQKTELDHRWRQGLVNARKKAIVWHNEQKTLRLAEAKRQANEVLKRISTKDISALELVLAFLYLGEGSKGNRTALGNSNPAILKFFLSCLYRIYAVKPERIRCYLHLRADQNEDTLKRYWSNELGISVAQFGKTSFDIRTKGRATYATYKGVCLIECAQVAIQRRLMYIADGFCERIILKNQHTGG